MVDIHSHILPFVDDGSNDLEISFEMLKSAAAAGTDEIVLTPHCNLYDREKNYLYEMQLVFDAFKQKVEERKINIKIYLGAEVFADESITQLLKKGLLPTINGSRFLMIEFDFYSTPAYICDTVRSIGRMGYVPIVAHPERYSCIKKINGVSMEIMNSGGLLQVNKGSLAGEFGESARQTALELISHNTAQFVASDAHSLSSRTVEMDLTYEIIEDYFGNKTAQSLLNDNPASLIRNGRLTIARPVMF